ncbi:hypothetical protein MATL_G00005440 [Megalops atlanticus]|uniref:Uncharacterized protein n=1 Tax=Megalops atlanticus TaxID=7932 RepID=A0A9D3TDE3_MEGAT|nr:hypothetical protein MATL_G00005440 [Megalops atlanticus]
MVGMELTAELFLTLSMVCFCVGSKVSVLSSWHMDLFIGAVQQTEDSNPGLEPLAVVRSLRRTASYEDFFVRHFLGEINSTDEEVLSSVLKKYYHHHLEELGLDAAPRLISVLRRENFRELVNASLLQTQVMASLDVYWRLRGETEVVQEVAVEKMVHEGVQEFIHRYIDCPVIIPRCQWRARPYRGTPTRLALPLSSMFIHHTHHPKPCHTFQQCAAYMRAMQSFHQDVRGWDDIGYSFVAGSDGYLYEGRGWQWRGAHTRGHNSRGYGVAFVGNYTATLPAQRSLEQVRGRLASCGVSGGRLVGNFTMYGHRQLVDTTCPGDALYAEIKGWQHFREIPSKQ